MRAWPTTPADTNVAAWLATIAHRKAIDVLRARRRHPITVGDVPEGPSSLGIPGAGDAGRDLLRVVSELPPRQGAAVTLHYLGGLPYREVAEVMGGSVDAARRAAADGVRTLRTLHLRADATTSTGPSDAAPSTRKRDSP